MICILIFTQAIRIYQKMTKECGRNVLELLFEMDDIHIYMNRPERIYIGKTVKICFNDRDIVIGKEGYEQWWTEEYRLIKLFNYKSDDFHSELKECRDKFIVIDNADTILEDED